MTERKRVNEDKDAHLAKMAKVDGNEAAGCRNLEEGEGEKLKEKIDRIRAVLEDDPKRLKKEDVEDVILYLDVSEIICLALKSDRANRKAAFKEFEYLEGGSTFAPSRGKVIRLLTLMLQCGVEKLKEVDLFILYQNFPKLAFAQLLLSALDSNALFGKMDECVMISKLCYALPWKLFTHIMYHKTSLPLFKRSKEEEDEKSNDECTIEKKAAESCEICCGKGKHSGIYGDHCSFWDCVPSGLTVGPSHSVECPFGSRIGRAVPHYMMWAP